MKMLNNKQMFSSWILALRIIFAEKANRLVWFNVSRLGSHNIHWWIWSQTFSIKTIFSASLLFIQMHSLLIINDPIVDVINLHLALACFYFTLRWLIFKFKRGTKSGWNGISDCRCRWKKANPRLIGNRIGIFYRTELNFLLISFQIRVFAV